MPASTTFHYMLDNCGMSVANYDALLTAFNASSLTGKTLGAVGRIYCASAADRANLVLPAGSGARVGPYPVMLCLVPVQKLTLKVTE